MSEFSPKEFAESVRAAIGTVNHLCIQVDRLNASLRDALISEPNALTIVSRLGSSQGKHRHDFRVVRFDHGVLFHADPADGDEDIDDEEDLDEELDTGDDAGTSRRKKRDVELSPDQPLLAVRTLLYDHKKPDDLEPQILYAVLGHWRVLEEKGRIEQSIRNLLDNITSGTRDLVEERLAELREERDTRSMRLDELECLAAEEREVQATVQESLRFLNDLKFTLLEGVPEAQRTALRKCVSEMEVDRGTRRVDLLIHPVPMAALPDSARVMLRLQL